MGFLKTLTNSTGNTNLPLLRTPTPADIISASLKAWYSADKLVTADGSNRVSVLGDQTTTAANLLQATSTNQPLLVASAQNGRPAIYNDSWPTLRNMATSAAVAATQFEYTTAFSIGVTFVAGAVSSAYEILFGNYAQSTYRGYWLNAGSSKMSLHLVDNNGGHFMACTDNVALTSGTTYSYIFTYDGSAAIAGMKQYKNGVLNGSTSGSGSLNGTDTMVDANQRIRLFGDTSSNDAPHKFLEGFICAGALTADQVSNIDTYFNMKYAIH